MDKSCRVEKKKRKYDKLKEATLQAKKEFHKRQGTYRKGMNLDDPFGEIRVAMIKQEEDKRKPAAKRLKTNSNKYFCEYCGVAGHLTKRSKKCTATLQSSKLYQKDDGTLLSEAPRLIVNNAEALDEMWDCDQMDSLPFAN